MTEDAPSGGSRRDIAGSSLRALRAARGEGSTPPPNDETPAVDDAPPVDARAEVLDDPSELTDDPAVQAEATEAATEPEVAGAEANPGAGSEAESERAAESGPAAEVLDDPSELTDDPAVQPAAPDVPEEPEADAAPEIDPDVAAAAEAEVEAPVDDESGAEAQADAEADALTDDPAEAETPTDARTDARTDAPTETRADTPTDAPTDASAKMVALHKAEAPAAADPAATEDRPSADDEPPALATSTPRSGRAKRSRPSAPPHAPGATRTRPRPLVAVASVVALVALAFGVVSGVVWYRAGHADARTVALARDQVVIDARVAITTVSTSDYRHPDAALSNWLEVTTGSLRASYSDSKAATVKLLAEAKTITTATVLDAAVTALNTKKGTATVIAGVNLTKKPATGSAIVTRNRLRASMKQVGGEWKLADLALVSVGLT